MVVDDIEDDADAQAVGGIDEARKSSGRAVEPGGGEQIDAVVAPAELGREIGDRHHLDDGDAEFRQMGRQLGRAAAQVPSRVKVPTCIS